MNPRFTLTALAIASLFNPLAHGSTSADEALIVVTATRFPEAEIKTPANVTIINREEIRQTSAANLPDLLRTRAGVESIPLFGSMAASTKVDLRGFGESASDNTLILLDGQRLNPIDSAGINWAIVPLANIQRIEIIRGSGAVLYGDRATGGVINIITDKSGREQASVIVQAGSFGSRNIDANLSGRDASIYYNLHAGHAESEGYRSNNQSDQDNLAGRIGLRSSTSDTFVDFALYRDSTGLPGALFTGQYNTDPRQARTPDDTQKHSGYRLRPGFTTELSSTLTVSVEAAIHREDYDYKSPSYIIDSRRENISLTPRLRWKHGAGLMPSETVVGSDIYRGEITNDSVSSFTGANRLTASQVSSSVYFLNTTELAQGITSTFGARSQRMNQEANDQGLAIGGEATRSRTSSELGINWSIDESWRLFGKVSRTWRYPNTDELFGYDPTTFSSFFAGDLRPQRATGGEIGTAWNTPAYGARINLYQQNLKDEIAYNGDTFNNENLSATRRQGIETEVDIRPAQSVKLTAAYTYQQAEFREGVNINHDLPMTSTNKASLTAYWDTGAFGRYGATTTYVGNRRASGDYANVRDKLPAYSLVDLQASWKTGEWTLTTKVLNAFDKKYSPYGGFSSFYSDYYYYPADGRSVQASLRYDFK